MALELEKIQTGIAGAYWCIPKESIYVFEKANLGREMTSAQNATQTAWFDELFDGGLMVPRKESSPSVNNVMTIMLNGPPGAGKSTLALELCYRLACNGLNQVPLRSVYLTTEGHPPWLIQHARNGFGWDPENCVLGEEDPNVSVDVRDFKTEGDIKRLESGSKDQNLFSLFVDHLKSPKDSTASRGTKVAKAVDWHNRDIVVFDNLNTIQVEEKQWVAFLRELGSKGPRIVVIVLDSSRGDENAKRWEYVSDTVIRLDRDYPDGYMIRTIEIMKARYQHHVFGPQQLKLLRRSSTRTDVPTREHPYREEGGIFIYPSMHFVLSRHNYVAGSKKDQFLGTPFKVLDRLLAEKGFLSGRCVALTGQRGTHKSRLAYAQLLYTLRTDPTAKAVLISLGDDEETTKRILGDILVSQFDETLETSPGVLDRLRLDGRLEIAYYPPGLITPYEFFHRILLSVSRMRSGNKSDPILLVFSSLEILSSHFPLCAKHSIFIPALIELLGYRRVTSFFVATSEFGPDMFAQHAESSGLLSMADPILSFERIAITEDMDFPWLGRTFNKLDIGLTSGESIVRMRVERFAAGTSAGSDVDVVLLRDGEKLATALNQPKGGIFLGDRRLKSS